MKGFVDTYRKQIIVVMTTGALLFSGLINHFIYFLLTGTIPGVPIAVSATTMLAVIIVITAFVIVRALFFTYSQYRLYSETQKHALHLPKRRFAQSTPQTQNL